MHQKYTIVLFTLLMSISLPASAFASPLVGPQPLSNTNIAGGMMDYTTSSAFSSTVPSEAMYYTLQLSKGVSIPEIPKNLSVSKSKTQQIPDLIPSPQSTVEKILGKKVINASTSINFDFEGGNGWMDKYSWNIWKHHEYQEASADDLKNKKEISDEEAINKAKGYLKEFNITPKDNVKFTVTRNTISIPTQCSYSGCKWQEYKEKYENLDAKKKTLEVYQQYENSDINITVSTNQNIYTEWGNGSYGQENSLVNGNISISLKRFSGNLSNLYYMSAGETTYEKTNHVSLTAEKIKSRILQGDTGLQYWGPKKKLQPLTVTSIELLDVEYSLWNNNEEEKYVVPTFRVRGKNPNFKNDPYSENFMFNVPLFSVPGLNERFAHVKPMPVVMPKK